MRRIPDERSTPRLIGAWVWWITQCVVITGVQLIPDNSAVAKYPRRPRRDCSDLRLAVREREEARDRLRAIATRARSRARAVRTSIRRIGRRGSG